MTTQPMNKQSEKVRLTPEQLQQFGEEMDAIRQRIIADLGEEDASYIRDIVKKQRQLELAGRALMLPPARMAVGGRRPERLQDPRQHGDRAQRDARSVRLDGRPRPELAHVRVGHRVPQLPVEVLHNYIHHTFTNILGKDRDVGYGILRMDEDQKWHPYYLGNPLYAFLLMVFFEWGVALHDLEVENIVSGKRSLEDNKPLYPGLLRKIRRQAVKDYVLFPALTGPLFPLTFTGNALANLVRNVWTFNIIFCGHFPSGAETFTEEECQDENALTVSAVSRVGTGTTARCSARPTSAAASCSTS